MNRFLIACILLLAALPASAQLRKFPEDAPHGYLSYIPDQRGGSMMMLNDKPVRVAPGLQIRDPLNQLIFPQMVKKDSIVKYKLEGPNLHRVWILTKEEVALPDKYKLPNRTSPEDVLVPKEREKQPYSNIKPRVDNDGDGLLAEEDDFQ